MTPGADLTLRVLAPEGVIFEKHNLTGVNVPLVDGGTIGIKPAHAPLIAETIASEVTYQTKELEGSIQLHAGILDIRDNLITILTAGEVFELSSSHADESQREYDRLMQTLIQKVYLEREQAG